MFRHYSSWLFVCVLVACGAEPNAPPTPLPAPTNVPIAPTTLVLASPTLAEPTSLPADPTSTSGSLPTPEPTAPADASEPHPTLEPALFGRTMSIQNPPLDGDDVKVMQKRLLALGYTQLGEADGVFGANTAAAVRTFQARNQLEADGIIGPRSWQVLFGSTPRAAEGAGPLIPVVDGVTGYLLGASRDGRWIQSTDAGALMQGGENYTLYLPDGSIGAVRGSQPGSLGIPCEQTLYVAMDPKPTMGIAIGAGLDPRPRPVRGGDPRDPALLATIQALLQEQGIAKPEVRISNVLVADLDGDGNTEQVVAATRMALAAPDAEAPSPDVAAGDYSLIAIVSANQPPVLVIGRSFSEAATFIAPEIFRVLDVLDLNGDGRLELVASSVYYEGGSVLVYSEQGGQFVDVIGNGCGV